MQQPIVYLAAIVGLGFLAQWISWRLRLPAILVLLAFGFAAGYFIDPEELVGRELLFPVISLSVAVILFEGGLSLRINEIRQTGRAVLGLVTVGIAVTWLLSAAGARWVLGLEPAIATLLGAILVVSGPTVIMPLLRHVRPNRRIGGIVKWEGIINDPIGAMLAVITLFAIETGGFGPPGVETLLSVVVFLVVGGTIGAITALVFVQLLKRYWIPDFLQNTAFLAAVVVSFVFADRIRPESGLVAVTLFGVLLANQRAAAISHVIEFKENLRVLLISCLFIVLASRLRIGELTALGMEGLVFLGLLIFVVRPLAVFVSTTGQGISFREKLFLSWVAPRGIVAAAVSSVFALELARHADLPPELVASADKLAPVTFLVIVGTVAVYGLTAGPLARLLGIAEANPQGILFAGASPLVREIAIAVKREGFHVLLVDTNQRSIAAARMAGLATSWANICSEYAREEIDLSGLGRLLAMTPNDEVNSLAAGDFTDPFGRAHVYQLPFKPPKVETADQLRPKRCGRVLFSEQATYPWLAQRFAEGAIVKRTPLSEEFRFDDFLQYYGSTAIVLFVVDANGKLHIRTADDDGKPQPGKTLISLVDPVDANHT